MEQRWTRDRLRKRLTAIVQLADGLQEGQVLWLDPEYLNLVLVREPQVDANLRARVELGGQSGTAELELTVREIGRRRLRWSGTSWTLVRATWRGIGDRDAAAMAQLLARLGQQGAGARERRDTDRWRHPHAAPARPAPVPGPPSMPSSGSLSRQLRASGRLPAMVAPDDPLALVIDARDPVALVASVQRNGARLRLRLDIDPGVFVPDNPRLVLRLPGDERLHVKSHRSKRRSRRLVVECQDQPTDVLERVALACQLAADDAA